MVRPSLYEGRVMHERSERVEHRFTYGVYWWLVDVDALPRLPRLLAPFARIEARDHLGDPHLTLRENVDAYLALHGIDLAGGRVFLLTNARVLGYVFNPLSVWYCLAADGRPVCTIAEVHNTYRERHCYLLHPDERGRCAAEKEFYVSPFFPVDGSYRMRLPLPADKASVAISLERGGVRVFHATFGGRARPLTARTLRRLIVRYPWVTLAVMARIRLHGLRLWARRVPVVRRPRHDPQEGVG